MKSLSFFNPLPNLKTKYMKHDSNFISQIYSIAINARA